MSAITVVIFDFWGVIYNPSTRETNSGLEDFLQTLKRKKIQCGIASSSYKSEIVDFLQAKQLEQYFDSIIGVEEVSVTKPNPECYLAVAQHFTTAPNNCLIIDDSQPALTTAATVGFQTYYFQPPQITFSDIHIDQLP